MGTQSIAICLRIVNLAKFLIIYSFQQIVKIPMNHNYPKELDLVVIILIILIQNMFNLIKSLEKIVKQLTIQIIRMKKEDVEKVVIITTKVVNIHYKNIQFLKMVNQNKEKFLYNQKIPCWKKLILMI